MNCYKKNSSFKFAPFFWKGTIDGLVYVIPFLLSISYSQNPSTDSLPDYRVAIDAGHSAAHPGATSARGKKEYEFNLNMAEKLLRKLKGDSRFTPFLIRLAKDSSSLQDRTRLAAEKKADVFISLHHDSVQPHYLKKWTHGGVEFKYCDKFRGYSVFYSEKNPQAKNSKRLAFSIGVNLLRFGFSPTLHHAEKIPGENRILISSENGVYQFDDLVVLKTATMPAILLECGVLVHRHEEMDLLDSAYQNKMVHGLAQALENYFQGQK